MLANLAHKAAMLRIGSLKATTAAGSGHPTSCLSAADIVSVLFFHAMRYDSAHPYNLANDQIIFSKGHAAPLLYAAWWQAGALQEKDLLELRTFYSVLEGHPTPRFSYVHVATGSLGNGLGSALGQALAARMQKLDNYFYVLMGDSENAEGSVWEAVELAAYYKTDHLIAVVDVNRLGQRGQTMQGHDTAALEKKYKAFGWNTYVVDGHSLKELVNVIDAARAHKGSPSVIIAHTYKGYGVSFLQDQEGWHGKALTPQELDKALKELELVDGVPAQTTCPDRPTAALYAKEEKDQEVQFDDCMATMSTRKAYGLALRQLGAYYASIIALDAEVKNSTYAYLFEEKFQQRFIECFIAEQNMINMAIGIAAQGLMPFASTFACFLTRAYDQIRMAALGKNHLRLVGSHAGISVGADGPSQMGLEDMAMITPLPNSVVLYPADGYSCAELVHAMVHYNQGISYLRTTREEMPYIDTPTHHFRIGSSRVIIESPDSVVTIVAAGITVHEALRAAHNLAQHGIMVNIIDAYSIKPFDKETVITSLKATNKNLIVVEDHYPVGGLGSAVQQALADRSYTMAHLCVREIPRSGTPQELRAWAGIDAQAIKKAIFTMMDE